MCIRDRPNAQALAQGETSLEGELTEAASSAQYTCPGTAAQALAAMPAEMRNAEIREQAMSTYLVGKLNTTIPLTTASIKTYYTNHVSSYDAVSYTHLDVYKRQHQRHDA